MQKNDEHVDFDNYADEYNNILYDNTKFFIKDNDYFSKYKIDILSKIISSNPKNILEFGCGIGRNLPFICRTFPDSQIYASDISEKSIKIAQKNNKNVKFFIERESFYIENNFDLIIASCVFHHILSDNRNNIIELLYNRLIPGGKLVIFEHNPYNPITRILVNTCPYDRDAVLISLHKIKKLLKKSNFSILNSQYYIFAPPLFAKFLPLDLIFAHLPIGAQYWVLAKRPEN